MNSTRTPGTDAEARLLSRRQLIAMGSLAAALPLVPRSAFAQAATSPISTSGPRQLRVSFLEGLEHIDDFKRFIATASHDTAMDGATAPNFRAVAADQLVGGDPSLVGQTLRVRIHGLSPLIGAGGAGGGLPLHGLDLDVLVPSPDVASGAEPLPFHAWTYRAVGPSPSPSVAFVLPVEREHMPELRLTVRPVDGEPVTYQTRFTVGNEPGQPRLRRGLYLLSAAPQTWLGRAVANWASGVATGAATVLVSFEGGAATAT